MALPMQKFREAVFQVLYSMNFQGLDEEIVHAIMEKLKITKKNATAAMEKAKKIHRHFSEMDELIRTHSKEYDFQRISKIELTTLRLGLYEMLYEKLPANIVIAESVRLNKKFGSKEGSAFVHALLDSIHKGTNDAS